MAINVHTDSRFEKYLAWLSRYSRKTKTDLIKELVLERYQATKSGFRFGAFRGSKKPSPARLQKRLKKLDRDHDLD